MKYFPYQAETDEKISRLMARIRPLQNGETYNQMKSAGVTYKKNMGVSIVHLRQVAAEEKPNQELARRLWYREFRETMILGAMLAEAEQFQDGELDKWGDMIPAAELSEQLGRHLLCQPEITESFLIGWLENDNFFKKYASAMGIGWRLRFYPDRGFSALEQIFPVLRKFFETHKAHHGAAFVLKMAVRFSPDHRSSVIKLVEEWKQQKNPVLEAAADEIREEIDLFL
jgi:hypothetical protein